MKTDQIYRIFREESKGVSTDTRTLNKGEIFFALRGDNYNGNKFAAEAVGKGALYAVIDDPAYETDKTILVDDSLNELQALAAFHRKELQIPVLAITGTNGKTTTKNLIAAVLAGKYKVHATPGNLNNAIGVPLTILMAPENTEFMILEMGANHIGEIRSLCLIASPDYGIITNVGHAHLEGFGSLEGVLKAKSELYEHLGKVNGIAIFNEKDNMLTEKIIKIVNRTVPYSNPCGFQLEIQELPSDSSLRLQAVYKQNTYDLKTNLFGRYNLENVRAAIATGLFFGVAMPDIVEAIEEYRPENNRSQVKSTGLNTLVCDAYNANPASMKLAIESFASLKAVPKMLILGDMLELGDKSEEEHLGILKVIAGYEFDSVLLAGQIFSKLSSGFGITSFPDTVALAGYLEREKIKGYHILIKGSRGMKLEQIYKLL